VTATVLSDGPLQHGMNGNMIVNVYVSRTLRIISWLRAVFAFGCLFPAIGCQTQSPLLPARHSDTEEVQYYPAASNPVVEYKPSKE